MSTASVPNALRPSRLVPIRSRKVRDQYLLTSHFGDWLFVSAAELEQLMQAGVPPGTPLEQRLRERNMLADEVSAARLGARLDKKRSFLHYGPHLHVMVVTLRCNQSCVYCHASRAPMDRTDTDMSPQTAEQVVDLALQSTSPSITIEFQGGEPLANFDVVRHSIEYALQRNEAYGKSLEFTLVTNLSLMTEARMDYLLSKRVQICTSVDGPAQIHDGQRKLSGGSAFSEAANWIARINKRYEALGLDPSLYHVEALLTTTRAALSQPRAIVDTYVNLGCRAIFLRPVDPFGFASRTKERIEYPRREYLGFYREALEYILELNKSGTQVLERFASIFLTKILTQTDPNFVDIRSPCGAGIGQLAYNFDGKVFTCDEGRMLAATGDSTFEIGSVGSRYRDLVTHDTVAAMTVASNLDAQPDCTTCAYNPYCGVCPVHSYATQGSIQGRMRESVLCAVHKGIQDVLFEKLASEDPEVRGIFRRWTSVRPRSHFVHA